MWMPAFIAPIGMTLVFFSYLSCVRGNSQLNCATCPLSIGPPILLQTYLQRDARMWAPEFPLSHCIGFTVWWNFPILEFSLSKHVQKCSVYMQSASWPSPSMNVRIMTNLRIQTDQCLVEADFNLTFLHFLFMISMIKLVWNFMSLLVNYTNIC